MNIGILSKRHTMLAGRLKDCLEKKGHNVSIYTLDNLIINYTLLNNDFYILKSNIIYAEKPNTIAFLNEKNRFTNS